MKPVFPEIRTTDPSAESPNPYLAAPARSRLEALRSTVDVRLAALERALASPSPGASLEALILDLARVATEEAQATAERACVDTRLEADMQLAQVRSAAQAALDTERTTTADLRRSLDEARRQLLDAERAHRSTLQEAHDGFEAERLRERAGAAEREREVAALRRSLAEAHDELEAARSSARDLRRELGKSDEQLAAAAATREHLDASVQQWEAEVAELRRRVADMEGLRTALDAEIAREREASAELRRRAARAADEIQALERRGVEAQQVAERLAIEARSATSQRLADVQAALEQATAELLTERGFVASLRRTEADLRAALQAQQSESGGLLESLAASAAHIASVEQQVGSRDQAIERLSAELAESRRLTGDAGLAHRQTLTLLERERAANEALRQAAAEAEARSTAALEAERAATAVARDLAARAQARLASFGQEASESGARYDQLAADLERERRAHAKTREDHGKVDANYTAAQDALSHARQEVQALREELERAGARIEQVVGERADSERLRLDAEQQFKRLERQCDELRTALSTLRQTPAATPVPESPSPPSTVSVEPVPARAAGERRTAEPASAPRDAAWTGVRMATRYGFRTVFEVLVNGHPATLCDLSTAGCRILSPSALKPNQAVKVSIPTDEGPTVCTGKIVWAKLEAPSASGPAGYRAGVQFSRPDEGALEAFIISHGAPL